MKKMYFSLIAFVAAVSVNAASYTVTIVGTAYAPATLTVNVGDVVTIEASGNHPLVEVDQSTWNASGTTPMTGGWGTKTANHTFTVTNTGTIYYVCSLHASMGMKGQIVANSATGIASAAPNFGEISVFPNPASEKINVKLNSSSSTDVTIALFSLSGQLIGELKNTTVTVGENNISIDLPGLAAGNYILQMNSEKGKVSRQISVVK